MRARSTGSIRSPLALLPAPLRLALFALLAGCSSGATATDARIADRPPPPGELRPLEARTKPDRAADALAPTTCATAAAYKIPVLVLRYFPTKGTSLDPAITGTSDSLTAMRQKVGQLTQQLEDSLEAGSAYHGYRDPQATCSINYTVVKDVEYLEALPLSTNEVPWNKGIYRPDYNKVLARESICDLVAQQGVKEVWLWGYHFGNLEPVESNMAGPNGNVSNSERRTGDMPVCAKTYVLYNYNFTRGLGEALEDHTHQLEAVLRHVDKDKVFWEAFVQPYGPGTARAGCGWTHFPPNGKQDYDWYNTAVVQSDCEDWNPQRTGALKTTSCATWGCTEDGGTAFKIWWMQNLPGARV